MRTAWFQVLPASEAANARKGTLSTPVAYPLPMPVVNPPTAQPRGVHDSAEITAMPAWFSTLVSGIWRGARQVPFTWLTTNGTAAE